MTPFYSLFACRKSSVFGDNSHAFAAQPIIRLKKYAALIVTLTIALCPVTFGQGITVEILNLPADLPVPETVGHLNVTWNASGMAENGDIYTVWCDQKGSVKKEENDTVFAFSDSALVRYRPQSREFEMLGSLVEVLKANDNWIEGEFVEKGHTPLPVVEDVVYIGTMEFHSIEGSRDYVMSEMEKYRGAHLLAYDIRSSQFHDLTKNEPGGVLFPKQGLIALDELPEFDSIICLSIPRGDIAIYNYKTHRVEARYDGPEEEFGNVIYRNVVACPDGRIYFGFCDYKNASTGRLWMLDVETGILQKVMEMPGQVFNGLAKSKDRDHFYAVTQFSDIYHFDNLERTVEHIGKMVPDGVLEPILAEGIQCKVYGVHLSLDGSKLYTIAMKHQEVPLDFAHGGRIWPNGKRYAGMIPVGVMEFDIASRQAKQIFSFEDPGFKMSQPDPMVGYLMCSQLVDEFGHFYMTRNSRPGLVKVGIQPVRN